VPFLAQAFRFFQNAIGSNESFALTEVSSEEAFPVVETREIAQRALLTRRLMVAQHTFAGAGNVTLDVDPRSTGDWSMTAIVARSLLPSEAGALVPADEDFLITGVALQRQATGNIDGLVYKQLPVGAYPAECRIGLWRATNPSQQVVYEQPAYFGNPRSMYFSPVGDPMEWAFYLNAAAAGDVSAIFEVLSGPPGTLPMF
jgi:hypothetical protein